MISLRALAFAAVAALLTLAGAHAQQPTTDVEPDGEAAENAESPVEVVPPMAAPAPVKRGPPVGERDLAPYFTGAAKKARAALDAGNAAQALALLGKKVPADLPTRFLRAQALKAAGRCKEARPELQQLAEGYPPLRDRALYFAGQCAGELGDAPGAIALYRSISQSSVDAGDAYLEAARLLSRGRPAREAAPLIEDLLAPLLASGVRGDPAAAHLVAGDAFLAAGNTDRAREHYRTAFLDFPLSGAADSARERVRKLSPGPEIAPGRLVLRVERLVEGGRFKQAAAEVASMKLPALCAGGCPGDRTPASVLKAALALLAPNALPAQHQPTPADVARQPENPADPLSCRAKLAQGRAYRKLRQYAQARAALAPVVLRCGDSEVRARALFVVAQLQPSSGVDAAPLWLALGSSFQKSPLADDAFYQAALLRRAAGDVKGERDLLDRLVHEQPDGDLVGEALFQLFWTHWSSGKPRVGIPYLDQLAERPDPDGASEERARYWRARAKLEPLEGETAAQRSASQLAGLEDLIWLSAERPLTYHGLLARSRLAEVAPDREKLLEQSESGKIKALANQQRRSLHLGPLSSENHLLAAIEYLRLGQPKDVSRELSALDRSRARAAGKAGYEALTLVADLYFRAGDLRSAHNLVRTDLRALLRHPATPLAVRAAQLAYPLAFRPEITDVATRAAFPADLLQALMREESALDPRAQSPVGALGLTQLMPRTAKEVATRLKIRGFTTARLYEPAINIRIGGTYFGRLYAHFKNPALALASYNAGPGNVGNWVRARGELPLDAFVEEIPLDETRGYVKRCLRSFAAYRYLYGTGPARVPHVGQQLAAN